MVVSRVEVTVSVMPNEIGSNLRKLLGVSRRIVTTYWVDGDGALMLELNVASKSESEIKWVEIARVGGGGGREGRTFNHQCSSACRAKYHNSIRLSTLEQFDSGTIKAANKQKIKAKETSKRREKQKRKHARKE